MKELREAHLERVDHGYSYVVDGWLGVLVECFVDADGVDELNGGQRPQVPGDIVLQFWNCACVSENNLCALLVLCWQFTRSRN